MNENKKGFKDAMQPGMTTAKTDLNKSASWYSAFSSSGAATNEPGISVFNTKAIFLGQGDGMYASTICIACNGAGYRKGDLQGKDDPNLLYGPKATVGSIPVKYYWRLSESALNNASFEVFINGPETDFGKNLPTYVNPVESF